MGDGQGRPKRCDLVLEGGGVKGIALVGALTVLEREGYEIQRIAGTSAGAIVGALLASGRTPSELEEMLRGLDYLDFKDKDIKDRFSLPGKLLSLLTDDGIYEGTYARNWVDDRLVEGRRRFGDIPWTDPDTGVTAPGGAGSRLVVLASDVTRRRLAHLPWDLGDAEGYPVPVGVDSWAEYPIADAVRFSMSIPYFFETRSLTYRKEAGGADWVSTMVDGGMLSNFPIGVFDRTDGPPRWPTFGIKLGADPGPGAPTEAIDGPIQLGRAMIDTMMAFYDGMESEQPEVQARCIFIDTGPISSTDFGLTPQQAKVLFDAGVHAATEFFRTWDFDRYVATYRREALR